MVPEVVQACSASYYDDVAQVMPIRGGVLPTTTIKCTHAYGAAQVTSTRVALAVMVMMVVVVAVVVRGSRSSPRLAVDDGEAAALELPNTPLSTTTMVMMTSAHALPRCCQ